MIKVFVAKLANYPIKAVAIKKRARQFLEDNGIKSDCEASVALVGKEKMKKLSSLYLKDDNLHNVLSFTESEISKKFIYPKENKIYLGEVVICYSKAVDEAKKENKRIEEKVFELLDHGLTHLLGVHHR